MSRHIGIRYRPTALARRASQPAGRQCHSRHPRDKEEAEKTENEEAKKEAKKKDTEEEAKTPAVDGGAHTDTDTATITEETNDEFETADEAGPENEVKTPGDVTPDWTPVATPITTPLVGKTKDQAHTPVDADDKTKAAEPADAGTSDSSGSPKDTPKSEPSTPDTSAKDKETVPVPPADASTISSAPPAPAQATSTITPASAPEPAKPAPPTKTQTYATSDGESSASPISDWEELYSSDDMTRKPHVAGAASTTTSARRVEYLDDTDDEKDPDPWNAIAVVGLRVYSKDEGVELRVVMEGHQLEEGGMGEKGEVDLDNGQANAGWQRRAMTTAVKGEDGGYEGDSEVEKGKGKRGDTEDAGQETDGEMVGYATIVQKDE